jgi:competence protein ComEC
MSIHSKTIIFVAGIAVGIVAGLSSPFASELAVAALLLGAVQAAVHVMGRKREAGGLALSFCTALFSFAMAAGIVRVQFVEEKVPYACGTPCSFEGTIVSSPESRDAYQTFVVRPQDAGGNAYDVQLRVALYPAYAIGETVRASGKMTQPSVIFPHGEEKSFDYASYLHTKNVGSEMMFPKIETTDGGPHTTVYYLGRWKEDFVSRIDMYVSSPASSLASGMLFGNSSMSKEMSETFRTAGLSHIVVLSGFNIAIVIAFMLFVFAFLPLVARILLAATSVILFVLMVGGEASVIRATLMSFVGLLAMFLGREYVARQALMLSLLAIIMYDPSSLLHDVSLHLSFLATAGIVYGSEGIKNTITPFVSRKSFVELLTTTLAAYLATLPYVMHTFGTVSAYALLANIFALPLVPFAMLFSFLVVLSSYVSHVAALVFGFADSLLLDAVLFIAGSVSRLPGASFSFSISFAAMSVAYIVVASSFSYFSRARKNETSVTSERGMLTDIIPY